MQKILLCAAIMFMTAPVFATQGARPATAALTNIIERTSGSKATVTQDGAVRIGWPRNDVPVQVDGMPFPSTADLIS